MFFSENIYFIIVFLVPASIYVLYQRYVRFVPQEYKDKSIELAECFAFAVVVFLCTAICYRNEISIMSQYLIYQDANLLKEFDYISFMGRYVFSTFINSVIGLFGLFVAKCVKKWFHNKYLNPFFERPKECEFDDVWSNIFETDEFLSEQERQVIEIVKGGKVITAGIIEMYPAPNCEKKEILVHSTAHIKEILREDKDKKLEDRVFDYTRHEYYDMSNDVLIKFYTTEKYDKMYGYN